MKRWIKFGCVVALVIAMAVVGLAAWVRFVHYPPAHARTCLVEFTETADRALALDIPNGMYESVISSAEHIERFYPVGTVLKENHPFAAEYTARREE